MFNGDLGVIEKINRIDQEMVVNFEGRPVEYDFGDWDIIVRLVEHLDMFFGPAA